MVMPAAFQPHLAVITAVHPKPCIDSGYELLVTVLVFMYLIQTTPLLAPICVGAHPKYFRKAVEKLWGWE